MNKISKKIVALVTMAAFVLTLVPAAAFAASEDTTGYTVTANSENAATVNVTLSDTDLGKVQTGGNVIVWAENDKGEVIKGTNGTNWAEKGVSYLTYSDFSGNSATMNFTSLSVGTYTFYVSLNVAPNYATTLAEAKEKAIDAQKVYVSAKADRQTSNFLTVKNNVNVDVNEEVETAFEINDNSGKTSNLALANVYVWAVEKGHAITDASSALVVNNTPVAENNDYMATVSGGATNSTDLKVKFTRDGEYTLYAGVATTADIDVASKNLLGAIEGQQVVVVDAAETGDVDGVTIDNAKVDSSDAKVYNATTNIKPNNTATATHTVTATIDGFAAKNETFKISTSSSNITVTAKDMNGNAFESGTATTDRNGEFQITYKIAKAGSYKIYLTSEDGYKVTLNVTSDGVEHYAADIALADFDASILNKDELNAATNPFLSDAVRFVITDNNGAELTTDTADQAIVNKEPAVTGTNKADYVSLTAPDKFKGEAKDFYLAVDTDVTPNVYTLQYKGNADFVAGEYTVRVALEETGKYVDATFTVGDFDENNVEGIKIVPSVDTIAYNKGDTGFTYSVKAVDKNGVEKDITNTTDYSIGVSAVDVLGAKIETPNTVKFNDQIDPADKDKYVGNEITLTAVSEVYSDIETAKVTVVDEGVVEGLAFSSESGEADTTNKVGVSVVDADGNVVKTVDADKTYVYVASQSNADANVEVEATKNVKAGKDGEITIYSDKETTVDVVVAVKDGQALYAGTLTYTIGAKDVNADKMVAMTIGSTDMVVNNKIVSGDAAPYVDSNWRTMVPIRALTESFGAKVDYDNDARTVTIVDGDTTIVMTIDSTTYTINGEEQTMDTAAVIGTGDRTYVPVRFVAEALGYKVTALQDNNGLTASVVFQK